MVISINEMSEIRFTSRSATRLYREFRMEGSHRANSFRQSGGLQRRSASMP